jgi:serine/threonine-protein kinase haspin
MATFQNIDSSRPRGKVYGRKRQVPLTSRDANLQLFGGTNASEIEKAITTLSISDDSAQKVLNSHTPHDASPKSRITKALRSTNSEDATTDSSTSETDHRDKRPACVRVDHTSDRATSLNLDQTETANLRRLLSFPGVKEKLTPFDRWGSLISKHYDVSKIGEGSYSDCFVTRRRGHKQESAVFKLIPLQLKSDKVSTASSVTGSDGYLREFQVLDALLPYHGFAQLRGGLIVVGDIPLSWIEAARSWLEETTQHDENEYVDPARKYATNQIFGVLEMGYAGRDLELLEKPSAFQAFDAFWMTAILVAKAEAEIEFEHRDLHMSNICYKAGATDRCDVSRDVVAQMKERPEALLGLSGLEITIIDYTHSRMKNSKTGDVLYNPEGPFTSSELEEYGRDTESCDQMDTVGKAERWMVQHAIQTGVDKYASFTPKTNVIWLAHVLRQLTLQAGNSKRWKTIPGSSREAKKVQAEIWKSLNETLKCIGSDDLDSLPASAEAFTHLAVSRGWLSQEDFAAFLDRLDGDTALRCED